MINSELQKTNKDLSIEKETITREYSYTEMFYKSLIQSADDGISFYDRDWNLKYANSAFYSMIGLTKELYNDYKTTDLVHPEDAGYENERTQALQKNGFFEPNSGLNIRMDIM